MLREAVKQTVSNSSRVAETALETAGGSPTLGFFWPCQAQPARGHLLQRGGAALGSYEAKVGVPPVCPALVTAIDQMLDNFCRPGRLPRGGRFLHARQPPPGSSSRHSYAPMRQERLGAVAHDASPYVPMARITPPPQEAHSPARTAYFDGVPSFRPGRSLQAHRPLGSVMCACLATYPALSDYRHQQIGVREREPTSHDAGPQRCPAVPATGHPAHGRADGQGTTYACRLTDVF